MSDIRDIADPESNSTRCRLPLGPIAHVYNGVVKTTLMYMAIAGSSGGFHARSGSFSATAVAQNWTKSVISFCTRSGVHPGIGL